MSLRSITPALASCLALALPAGAQAQGARHLDGFVRDVPSGTRIEANLASQPANLPYGGGPVLHSNRTHAIFWEPAGSQKIA